MTNNTDIQKLLDNLFGSDCNHHVGNQVTCTTPGLLQQMLNGSILSPQGFNLGELYTPFIDIKNTTTHAILSQICGGLNPIISSILDNIDNGNTTGLLTIDSNCGINVSLWKIIQLIYINKPPTNCNKPLITQQVTDILSAISGILAFIITYLFFGSIVISYSFALWIR